MKKAEPDRGIRLAEALRANLRRRKGQARDQRAGGAISPPARDPPMPDPPDPPAGDGTS